MLNKEYLKRKVVIISMISCLLLIVANFLPIIRISTDALDYTKSFQFAMYEGKYIIFLAIVAFLLFLFEEPKYAAVPLFIITIILGYLVFNRSSLYDNCSFYENMFSWGIGLYALIITNLVAYTASIAELLKGKVSIKLKNKDYMKETSIDYTCFLVYTKLLEKRDFMGLTAGIVGLPNVGKSTLFNAITKKNILAANYPFATIDPNVGVVVVPDKRLEFLENMYSPERTIPTAYEFTDIAGLVKGASLGEGLGNQFLSHIREVDAIVEVVRCFEDSNIIHVEGGVDPIRDIEIINVELMLADLDVVNTRIDKIGKKAAMSKDKDTKLEAELLSKAKEALEKDIPLRKLELTLEEEKLIRNFHFLTIKPIIYMANVSEEDLIQDGNKYVDEVRKYASKENAEVVVVSAKIESELSELNDEDKMLFLNDLGIKESGLDKLVNATYHLLGLATYFTAGSDECRAWTFKKGMKAPECAGIIHTDFERGFIKAEVMSFSDLEACGSEKAVKEAGKLRLEGKEYIMQDGDICLFRFNV